VGGKLKNGSEPFSKPVKRSSKGVIALKPNKLAVKRRESSKKSTTAKTLPKINNAFKVNKTAVKTIDTSKKSLFAANERTTKATSIPMMFPNLVSKPKLEPLLPLQPVSSQTVPINVIGSGREILGSQSLPSSPETQRGLSKLVSPIGTVPEDLKKILN